MAKHFELTEPNAIHPAAFVGATDPALVAANNVLRDKLWVDTSVGPPFAQKVRNSTNTAWQAVGSSGATDGWVSDTTAWAYSSSDAPSYVVTVVGDVTGTYALGMKLKLTHAAATKYFIVTKISFGGGSTTMTVYGGTTYTLAATAITNVFYSMARAPYGFPLDPDTWTEALSDTSDASQATPASGTWYNLGSLSKSLPIGLWDVSYEIWLQSNSTTSGVAASQYVSLSTANNSESDTAMSSWTFSTPGVSAGIAITAAATVYKSRILSLAAKTTYYLVSKTIHANINTINFRGAITPTILRARCAYL